MKKIITFLLFLLFLPSLFATDIGCILDNAKDNSPKYRNILDSKSLSDRMLELTDRGHGTGITVSVTQNQDADDVFKYIPTTSVTVNLPKPADDLEVKLACIAGISLLVGGIGIMNIMLVSVAERTKEIGIRKALGASPRVIRGQFITEAIVLTLAGGILGILIGTGLSKLVTDIAGWTFKISVKSYVLSMGFSMLIGVFFGWYPAKKASKLDPIIALNYE